MKRLLISLLLVAASAAICTPAQAQDQAASTPDDLRSVLEMMRSDLNGYKIRTINEVMKLTGPEADKFWPIYRNYEKELAAVGDRKLVLIREFTPLLFGGTLDDKKASDLAKRWLQNTQDRLDLWRKYHQQISKAVSPIRAAQFLQVEHQMALFLDVNIAGEMPVIGAKPAGR